jgi:hypothetical protein
LLFPSFQELKIQDIILDAINLLIWYLKTTQASKLTAKMSDVGEIQLFHISLHQFEQNQKIGFALFNGKRRIGSKRRLDS